jgi:catechol 2,3-dioxygenase-like lactoylglutathione lyase family enzyme
MCSNLPRRNAMFDHVGLNVRDYAASRAFYEQALAPLGYSVAMAFDEWKAVGFGTDAKPEFWVSEREPFGTGTHVAFTCDDHATVDAFHVAALAAGGRDNGPPGLREHYHPTYYGAFVLDPDGNNVEAVCHR